MKKKLMVLIIVIAIFLIVMGILLSQTNDNLPQPTPTPTLSPQETEAPEQGMTQEEIDGLVAEKKAQYASSLQETFKDYLSQLYDSTYITDEMGNITHEETTISILMSQLSSNESMEFDMSMFHTDEIDCSEENSYGIVYFHSDGTNTYEVSLNCLLKIEDKYYNLN